MVIGGLVRAGSLVAFTQYVRAVSRLGNVCVGTEAALEKWKLTPGAGVLSSLLRRASERPVLIIWIVRVSPSDRSPKVVIQFGSDVSPVQSIRSRSPPTVN